MNYVIDGTSYILEENNQQALEFLRNRLRFMHELLFLKNHDRVISDFGFSEKVLDNEDVKSTLLMVSDYDEKNMLLYALHYILQITDFEDLGSIPHSGTSTDQYRFNNQTYRGEDLSFVELAYENDWDVLSLNPINIDNIKGDILKNRTDDKSIFIISSEKQYYLHKSVRGTLCDLRFYQSFDNVLCADHCQIDDWDSLSLVERLKVLSTFYKEIEHVINNNHSQIGRRPGRNQSRLENLNEIVSGCVGYRLANPNYRIYFLKKSGQVTILLGRLKRENEITASVKNKIRSIANGV